MPSFKRRASVTDPDPVEDAPKTPDAPMNDALTLAEVAEAEAAEAEAIAAAARAKARAIRLRREAQESEAEAKAEAEAEAETAVAVDAEADDEAVVEHPDTADEGQEETAPRGRRWGLVLKIVAMTLAVLGTAALITLSVLMVNQHRKVVATQQLDAEYQAAGRQSVVTLMSLDFNNAEADVQRIIDNTTGQFQKDFQDQQADFVKVAQDAKVITDVNVTATAVESMTPTSAVVLIAATSRVTNSSGAKQEPRAWRLSVNLERVDGGQVKMSKVEFVP
ncbi:hypothetical protein [Mycolicibacterium tusciae]|uniref:hypothetical protein n=1 Tax=Mycolicibacterium tusciae TaxID=75922 RepID=UPI00024A21D9|nr:hypothetical protein [Mycolicibacterium tusciae]